MAFLELHSINTYYGRSHILFDVSLAIEKGEVASLIGRNGAGKSTTFRSIIGLTPPQTGEIIFNGARVNGLRAYQICRRGIGFVPEDRRVFPDLTVRENLEVAARREQESPPRPGLCRRFTPFSRVLRNGKKIWVPSSREVSNKCSPSPGPS